MCCHTLPTVGANDVPLLAKGGANVCHPLPTDVPSLANGGANVCHPLPNIAHRGAFACQMCCHGVSRLAHQRAFAYCPWWCQCVPPIAHRWAMVCPKNISCRNFCIFPCNKLPNNVSKNHICHFKTFPTKKTNFPFIFYFFLFFIFFGNKK
jgi:hypothetical protein